jgi:hypothetical protein
MQSPGIDTWFFADLGIQYFMERLNPCRYFDSISYITPSEDEKYLENYPGCQLISHCIKII